MYFRTLYVIAFLLLTNPCWANEDDKVKEVINSFLRQEMEGIEYVRNDQSMVKLSENTKSTMKENPSGAGLFLNIQPIRIVSGFKVTRVIIQRKVAFVRIVFDQIGKTSGVGLFDRKIIPESSQEVVTYELRKTRNGWRVYDPPEPRISKEAILLFYKERTNRFQKIIDSGYAVEYQKKQFYKDLESLSIVKNLDVQR